MFANSTLIKLSINFDVFCFYLRAITFSRQKHVDLDLTVHEMRSIIF